MGIAAAIIAGGAVAAGGSIAGSALAASGAKGARDATYQTSDLGGGSNPLVALAQLQKQIEYGLVDPTTLLRSSPMTQALELAFQQPMTQRDRDHLAGALIDYRIAQENGTVDQWINNWWNEGNLRNSAQFLGLTPNQLIEQEKSFQARVVPIIQQAQQAATGNFATRQAIQKQILSLGEGVIGQERIPELEKKFKESLTYDINKQANEARLDLLRTGNFANFNPGRAVGDVEESRFQALRNVDTDALIRAVQVLTSANAATGSQANVLQGLLGDPNPNILAAATQYSAPTIAGTQADNKGAILGAGIAQGANTLGSSISSLGILSALQKPGTTT